MNIALDAERVTILRMRRPYRTDDEYNEYVKDFYRKIEDYDWNAVTDNFSGLESFFHRSRERTIQRLVAKYGKGNNYLDIGCGTGLILRHLPPGSTAIDVNPRHVARAQAYVPSATVLLGDAENLSFSDASFSTVVCTEVLEHLVLPQRAVREIRRVLRPGGVLIGSTPRRALIWRLRFLSSTHYHNEPFHNEFYSHELQSLLQPFHITLLRRGFLGANLFFVAEKK